MTYYWQQVPSAFTWFCNFKNWHNLYQREDNVDNMMILKKKYCYQKYSFINNIVYIWITMLKIRESLTKKDSTLFDLTNNSAKNITDWLWLSGIQFSKSWSNESPALRFLMKLGMNYFIHTFTWMKIPYVEVNTTIDFSYKKACTSILKSQNRCS